MVAVGNLIKCWAGVPDDDEQLFAAEFLRAFGAVWEEVLVGSEKQYLYHRFWDACFAVNNLKLEEGITIADLPVVAQGCTKQTRCNIIVG